MANRILLIGFLIFILIILLFIFNLARRGINILANPPVSLILFLSAKILAFVSCVFIPLGVLWPRLKWFSIHGYLSWLAPVLFITGCLLAIMSMKKLGDDLIFGLPEEDIKQLQTDGIYRVSRNPLYLGFFMIIVASCLSTPNPFNLAAGVFAISIHHIIILREEKFLIAKHGGKYKEYMKKTGRYLLVWSQT